MRPASIHICRCGEDEDLGHIQTLDTGSLSFSRLYVDNHKAVSASWFQGLSSQFACTKDDSLHFTFCFGPHGCSRFPQDSHMVMVI